MEDNLRNFASGEIKLIFSPLLTLYVFRLCNEPRWFLFDFSVNWYCVLCTGVRYTVYCTDITCNIHDNTDTNFQRFVSYMRDSRRGHKLRVRTVDQLCWPPLRSDDINPVYVQKQEIPSGSFLIAVLGARSSAVSV